MTDQLSIFALAVGAFGIVGIVIGMLVAPRLARLAEREEEDDGDGTD